MGTAMKNLHVPLEEPVYSALQRHAAKKHTATTRLAREAIAEYLVARQREEAEQALAEYVRAVAGSMDDLDPLLEGTAVEHMLGQRPGPGRRRR